MLYTSFSLGFGLVYLICLYMLLRALLGDREDPGTSICSTPRPIWAPGRSPASAASSCRCRATASSRAAALVFLTCIGVFATPMLLGGPTTVLFPETISGFFHGASDKWPVGAAFRAHHARHRLDHRRHLHAPRRRQSHGVACD
jgi:spermidine/putrescine transport system permease protein